jgi:hypothetical protein
MGFMLGNLTVDQIQSRTGVIFSPELIEYMSDRHQDRADNVAPGKWHCFDVPFTLVCGDMETAQAIYAHLKDQSKNFKQAMQIAIVPRIYDNPA